MSSNSSPDVSGTVAARGRVQIEADAGNYRSHLRSGGQSSSTAPDYQESEASEDNENDGIEGDVIEQLIEGNETLPSATLNDAR